MIIDDIIEHIDFQGDLKSRIKALKVYYNLVDQFGVDYVIDCYRRNVNE